MLKRVGIKKSAFGDIEAICKTFGTKEVLGEDIDTPSVIAALPKLEGLGIIRFKGLYVEIQSQFLANRLAKQLIKDHKKEFLELFLALKLPSQLQLIGRLQGVGAIFGNEWQFLFRNKEPGKGPLCDFQTAISNSQLLYPVACVYPQRILGLIDKGLKGTTVETRQTIKGDARRRLVWALEELLFHRETCAKAILNLGLLAEAEVEDYYANNATGVFCSFFFPHHPQASWSFRDQLDTLDQIFFTSDYSDDLRCIGITAIDSSLNHMAQLFMAHSSDAPIPLDSPPVHLESEYLDYIEYLIDILKKIAEDSKASPILVKRALAALPKANVESMIPVMISVLRLTSPARRLERTITRFEKFTEWALIGIGVSISDLDTELNRCYDLLNKQIAEGKNISFSKIKNYPDFKGASDYELKNVVADVRRSVNQLGQYAHQVQTLIKSLDQAKFSIRLKKWVGAARDL